MTRRAYIDPADLAIRTGHVVVNRCTGEACVPDVLLIELAANGRTLDGADLYVRSDGRSIALAASAAGLDQCRPYIEAGDWP